MNAVIPGGWPSLLAGYPWFEGERAYPIPAYSEFMPAPRLGRRPLGEEDTSIFDPSDDFGWQISEQEEQYELGPGLANLANQILRELVELGEGKPAWHIAGHRGRNLVDNPFWPPDLAAHSGRLSHERYVIILPLALSRTQDEKGRLRWTFFGGSEQGPEKAFWKSLYSAPGKEKPAEESLAFLTDLLTRVYGETCRTAGDLAACGFRVLPSGPQSAASYWRMPEVPPALRPFLWKDDEPEESVRFLLTFQPFGRLPEGVRLRYLAGELALIPFPGSLVFWGVQGYIQMQNDFPMAIQLPLQRLAARHGGPEGIRVPQSGWFVESGTDFSSAVVQEKLLRNTYLRTHRNDRIGRHENEIVLSTIEDRLGRVLFSTQPEVMGLYGKPMARNAQIWREDWRLLLDGPGASREQLEQATLVVAAGGAFRYRFQFPAMRVGRHEIYWQRPLAAFWSREKGEASVLPGGPEGYITAYAADGPDLGVPLELWPRLMKRHAYLSALGSYAHLHEYYQHQSELNILRILDTKRRWGKKPLPRSLARQILRLPEQDSLEKWLDDLSTKARDQREGQDLRKEIEKILDAPRPGESFTSLPGQPAAGAAGPSLTFDRTATRQFQEGWYRDIRFLSTSYTNKDNADCVQDKATLPRLSHLERDLEPLGDYLLGRYRAAIESAVMAGSAICGELPFNWDTPYDFPVFGGWLNDQKGLTHERNLVLVIPGRRHDQTVILADHYDTAYMEDEYEKSRGGSGARLSAAGADDNCSATATLLQSAQVFLDLARRGILERDIWLVHLTGEEFPSDCLGARHLAQGLIQKTLKMRTRDNRIIDLSGVKVVGAFILDMIAHNRDGEPDVFQISPGKGRTALQLAWQAHLANAWWNGDVKRRGFDPERPSRNRAKRIVSDGDIPDLAASLPVKGEVRLSEDPRSALFNTDGQIFSDCGIPVVLFMEDYDISRSGYHDSKDTMENIDLDYGVALAAIAIETVARVAAEPEFPPIEQ